MNISKIEFLLNSKGTSKKITQSFNLNPNSGKIFYLVLDEDIDEASIAPVIKIGNTEKSCEISSKVKLKGCSSLLTSLSEEYLSYWRLEGNLDDLTERSPGTFNGEAPIYVEGRKGIGKALSFDGANNYIRRANFNIGNQQTRTFSTWIKLNNLSSGQNIIGLTADANNYKWTYFYFEPSEKISFMFGDNSWYNLRGETTNTAIQNTNEWYHVAIVVDITQSAGNRVKIFVNGVNQAITFNDDNGNDIYDGSDLNLYVGASDFGNINGTTNFFNGTIDKVQIYNRALSL